jgi:hypothetical protein
VHCLAGDRAVDTVGIAGKPTGINQDVRTRADLANGLASGGNWTSEAEKAAA